MPVQESEFDASTGDEGYLLDPNDWDEDIAERLAAEEGIELTAEHWRVIRFTRDWYAEHGSAPSPHDMAAFEKKHLFELFPHGCLRQSHKIAGMREPLAWSPG